MVKRLRALFAKAMSLFNMMFFTIKKPAIAGLDCFGTAQKVNYP